MSNQKLGTYSSIASGLSTAVFAISLMNDQMLNVAFAVCMVLSWSYVLLTCAFAGQASLEKKGFAYAGMCFACIYAALINVVYYTQLTTVLHESASQEILQILTYEPGTWMFTLDILGYGMMALSTFFVGLTIIIHSNSDKWLKTLLMLHGAFTPLIALPILNPFHSPSGVEDGSSMGVLVLLGWSVIFIPIMVLSAVYFSKLGDKV